MANYQTIHTNYGLAAIAAAVTTGVPINLTHMAVGDGGGSPVTPLPTMTALVNQRYQATINRVQQDPANPARYWVEMLIPASVGGWTIREFGIKDAGGSLVAVGNFPDTYKTLPSDGAVNDLVVRVELIVSNAGVITIQIDPNVAVASQAWVLSTVTPCYLIPGGTTGQVLKKASNTCGDVVWGDIGTVNVVVNIIPEIQSVISNPQLTFNLATCTTNGLTVHVGGALIPRRAGAGGWLPGTPSNTQVVFGTQYPIGTEVVFMQNEPAGLMTVPLDKSQNLADVIDKAAARTNLSVYSKTEADQINPAGAVGYFAQASAPTGWLKANGAAVSRTTYSRLFAAIGTLFGVGDGSTTFNLPDLRGEFVRGWDDGRGVNTGRALGSFQDYATAVPKTNAVLHLNGDGSTSALAGASNPSVVGFARATKVGEAVTASAADAGASGVQMDVINAVTGDAETRPRSVALLACIRY